MATKKAPKTKVLRAFACPFILNFIRRYILKQSDLLEYVSAEDNIINKTTSSTYSEYYIKRIIGLPGDTVTWKDGVLKINGEIIKEDYIKLSIVGSGTSFDGIFSYKKDGELQPTTTVIPDGYYFVMGDNRNTSQDARYWRNTYVSKDKIPFFSIKSIHFLLKSSSLP